MNILGNNSINKVVNVELTTFNININEYDSDRATITMVWHSDHVQWSNSIIFCIYID